MEEITNRIAKRFREVRERLGLSQSKVANDLNNYIKTGKINIGKKINFKQETISFIETNRFGVKTKIFALHYYYEKFFGINPNYIYSYSEHEPMFLEEKYLDVFGDKKRKEKIKKIFKQNDILLNEVREKIINEIVKEIS